MMTVQLDMTAELAAIPHGLAIGLVLSFAGIVLSTSRAEIRAMSAGWRDSYRYYRDALRRRHIRAVQSLRASNAH